MKTAFEAAGDIREVDLLAAFVEVWREGTSGSLRFSRSGTTSAGFDLADGEIAAVFSSEPRFETAAILMRAGKLDPAALERLSVPPGTDGAMAALAAGILTKREWKWGEKIRAIEVLADMLSWPDGKYLFDADARPVRGEFVLSVPRLLLELFLRSRDRNLIEHQLGATDVALVRSEAFDEEFATFGLTADAESVVRLIDDRATASEISKKAPAEEFAVLKLLAALKTLGLLRTEDEQVSLPKAPELPSPQTQPPVAAERPPFQEWATPATSQATREPSGEGDSQAERVPDLGELPLGDSAPEKVEVGEKNASWSVAEGVSRSEPQAAWETVADSSAPEEIPVGQWEPSGETLDPLLQASREPPADLERSGRRPAWLLGGLVVFLAAAIVGTVLLRWRFTAPEAGAVRATRPPLPAATAARSSTVTSMPAPTAAATPLASPPAARRQSPAPVPTARPAPAPTPPPAPLASSNPARAPWLERSRRDSRRLRSESKTRYAIQLELACETPSLIEAWRHDRPSGSMWLLSTQHAGRECFRVLWGRYGSLEEARKAKGGIPSYFVTATNHPAVVSVR